jgi:NADPH:quinone reductase-like Zn-dependent oxidoreductase
VRLGGGFWKPKDQILGSDVAGVVEAVGADVTEFRPGDEVLGDTLYHGHGGFAEYVAVPAQAPIVAKPPGITFAQAATLPQGAVLALQGLRAKQEVRDGHQILINGAGGGSGTLAVQMAKSLGAEVTGVDAGDKFEVMRSAGADHVIDYTAEDFTRSESRYDRILDFVGSRSLFAFRRVLKPDGVYLIVGGSMPRLLQAVFVGWLITRLGRSRMGLLAARPNRDDLSHVAHRVATGELTPLIDEVYGLHEVPAALSRLGEGRACGKLVIDIG